MGQAQRDLFMRIGRHLWLMTGKRQRPEEGERDLSRLAEHGFIESVDWEFATSIRSPGPSRAGPALLPATLFVIALGAERHPEAVPGFAEAALDLYEAAGALRIDKRSKASTAVAWSSFVARTPFSCSSAPYEAAFLVDTLLRGRGVRQRSEIAVYAPEDMPMPVAGPEVGAALVSICSKTGELSSMPSRSS